MDLYNINMGRNRERIMNSLFITAWSALLSAVDGQLYRESTETCLFETLTAACNGTDIILVESAYFGRMRAGACDVSQAVGNVGCSLDVLQRIEPRCSGKHYCEIDVTTLSRNITDERKNGAIFPAGACPGGLEAYLEVIYSCLTVYQYDAEEIQRMCSEDQQVMLPPPGGYISSTSVNPGGTEACPWMIIVPRGQTVRFVLYTFTVRNIYPIPGSGTAPPQDPKCSAYLHIFDNGERNIINLCDGYSSERHIYTSYSNSLQLAVVKTVEDMGSFVIQYQDQGCPYFEPPENTHVTFEADLATVVCNFTKETWFLTCGVTSWLGTVGNCTEVKDDTGTSFSWGILIAVAIGVGIGLVVGLSLLGLVFLCRRLCCPEKKEPAVHYQPHLPPGGGSLKRQRTDVPPMEELIHAANKMAKHGPGATRRYAHPGYAQHPGYAYQPHASPSRTQGGSTTTTASIEHHPHGDATTDPRMRRPPSEEHIYERYKYRKGDSAASSVSSGPHERIPIFDPSGKQPSSFEEYPASTMSSKATYPTSTMSTNASASTSTAHPVDGGDMG